MSETLRVLANCLFAAALFIGAVWVMVLVDAMLFRNGWNALTFFFEHFSRDTYMFAVWVCDLLRLIAFGAVVALLMLLLKPRRIVLYGLATIVPQIWLFSPLKVISGGSLHHSSLTLVSLLSIPLLYWIFCRISENRHNKSLNADASDAGAA